MHTLKKELIHLLKELSVILTQFVDETRKMNCIFVMNPNNPFAANKVIILSKNPT